MSSCFRSSYLPLNFLNLFVHYIMKKIITATFCSFSAPVLAFGPDQAGGRDGGGLTDSLDIVSILIGLVIGVVIGYLVWGRKK